MKRLTTCLCLLLASLTLSAQEQQPAAKDLKAVTVTAIKPFVTQKGDKVILNLAESAVSAGGNAWESIKKGPGIIEQNGALSFRGKKVQVLLDGRPSNLDGAELQNLLSSMPANTISTIELMSNPSSKYDAAGGAVINIVSTKSKKFGTNGSVNTGTGAGRYARYNAGMLVNYRNEKLNTYGSYDYRFTETFSNAFSDRALKRGQQLQEETFRVGTTNNHYFKSGLEYSLNARHTIGIMVKGGITINNANSFTHSTLTDSFSTTSRIAASRIATPSVNLYYKWNLNAKGAVLSFNADHLTYDKKWNDDFVTNFYNAGGKETSAAYQLRDQSPASNRIQSLSMDYSKPGLHSRLEMGLKTTFTRTDNDVVWEEMKHAAWYTDSGRTNHFIFSENIVAAYINGSRQIGKYSMQAGLRAEQTYTKGDLVTWNRQSKRNYFNLFPNVNIGYAMNDNNEFSISYRKSIQRFKFDVVNPFIVFRSQYNYYQGNPNIRPSISHNFEVGHSFKNQLFSSIGYSHYTDALSEVYRPGTIAGSVISMSENIGTGDMFSATVSHTKGMLRNKWNMTNTINTMYCKYNTADPDQNQGMITTNISSQHTVLLPHGFKTELFGSYTSPMIIGAYRIRSVVSVDAGIAKSVLKNQGSISVSVTDLFNTNISRFDVKGLGVNSWNRNKIESRFLKINFTWKFGNKNVKASTNRKSGIDAESKRMGE